MNKADKYKLKISKLNKAAKLIKNAITLLKETFEKNSDVDIFIWRLNKANDKLQKYICKKLELDYINEEIDKMEKRLKRDNE